jgi:hypothetical protein
MYSKNLGEINLDWLSSAVVPLVQGYSQVQLIKAQTERMRRGLPAMDATQYAPAARVQHTLSTGEGTNRTLLIGGAIGLAALLLVTVLGRKR